MTIPRLYLDEDVDPLLARILTDRNFDVLTTRDAGRLTTTDSEQLAFAAQERRAILTHNIAHFAALAVQYARTERTHSGIALSEQLPLKELLKRMLRLLHQNTAGELHNRLIWLQDFR